MHNDWKEVCAYLNCVFNSCMCLLTSLYGNGKRKPCVAMVLCHISYPSYLCVCVYTCIRVCVCVLVSVCLCVCVCKCVRERERQKEIRITATAPQVISFQASFCSCCKAASVNGFMEQYIAVNIYIIMWFSLNPQVKRTKRLYKSMHSAPGCTCDEKWCRTILERKFLEGLTLMGLNVQCVGILSERYFQ